MADRRVAERRADDAVRQELLTHIEYLREDVKAGFLGTHQRLDTLNGRVVGLEKRESAHHERIGALEKNGDDDAPMQSRKRTAVTLSLGVGGGAVLVKLIDVIGKALGG